jgi:hypothetical protein
MREPRQPVTGIILPFFYQLQVLSELMGSYVGLMDRGALKGGELLVELAKI